MCRTGTSLHTSQSSSSMLCGMPLDLPLSSDHRICAIDYCSSIGELPITPPFRTEDIPQPVQPIESPCPLLFGILLGISDDHCSLRLYRVQAVTDPALCQLISSHQEIDNLRLRISDEPSQYHAVCSTARYFYVSLPAVLCHKSESLHHHLSKWKGHSVHFQFFLPVMQKAIKRTTRLKQVYRGLQRSSFPDAYSIVLCPVASITREH